MESSSDHPFKIGDLVEYVGPETDRTSARPGERGRLITEGAVGDPPPAWVVDFGTVIGVYPIENLVLVEEAS